MQMDNVTIMILKLVISVCAALITAYAVPYLKTLKNDARYERMLDMVALAVRAAEQTITGSGQGAVKKAEVIKFVSEWLYGKGINITEDELDQLIEAAVYSMKQEG
ncbi:MAG: phage holin [Lachnospiraceae bacterium]|nr:phage holin [Lachnospiraceae bacterium]MBR3182766.1 phage holin [Bacillota bacterium]MBR3374202.1 phage holin [Bacillota bacterium]